MTAGPTQRTVLAVCRRGPPDFLREGRSSMANSAPKIYSICSLVEVEAVAGLDPVSLQALGAVRVRSQVYCTRD